MGFQFKLDTDNPDSDPPLILLGGSSFVGLSTAQTLFYNYNLFCSYFSSQVPQFFPEFIWSRINFLDKKTIKRLLISLIKRSKAKFLVNFVGITTPREAKENPEISKIINLDINELIIDVCNKYNIFPIFISSDHIFSGTDGPYNEDFSPNPLSNSVYGYHKSQAEYLYIKNANNYAIIRLSITLGINLHFQKQNVYSRVLHHVKNNKQILGAENKYRTPSHVYNVPFLIHNLIHSFTENKLDNNKLILHLPGDYISEYDLFIAIAKSMNADLDLIQPEIITNDNESYPLNLGLESSYTRSIINIRYLTLDEGLKLLHDDFTNALKQ